MSLLQVKIMFKTSTSLSFRVRCNKNKNSNWARTVLPPQTNHPVSHLATSLCFAAVCCCFADKLASWQQTGSLIHRPDESKPYYTEQGVRHRSKNNAVSPSRLFVSWGQSVGGAACCQTQKVSVGSRLWSNNNGPTTGSKWWKEKKTFSSKQCAWRLKLNSNKL